uniref:Uncharacterized protein n=1 Tax=Arundo donax TaxID=35708 RepID=A0A0A8YUP2_ARUDO
MVLGLQCASQGPAPGGRCIWMMGFRCSLTWHSTMESSMSLIVSGIPFLRSTSAWTTKRGIHGFLDFDGSSAAFLVLQL